MRTLTLRLTTNSGAVVTPVVFFHHLGRRLDLDALCAMTGAERVDRMVGFSDMTVHERGFIIVNAATAEEAERKVVAALPWLIRCVDPSPR